MSDPTIVVITDEQVADPHWVGETLEQSARKALAIPARYADAVVDVPAVADWVKALVEIALQNRRIVPYVRSGPSLLLLGKTGTGKTHQAYGAIRAIGVSGVGCSWLVTTAADMYAQLRPRPKVDSEAEFRRYADVGLLVLDDLGAAKGTEWNEEVNYRLINHRYENELPTLVTSNVAPPDLVADLGGRVASRLVEMADRVVLRGPDRRLGIKAVS